jgi:predicted dehydrogenase
MAYRAALIGCGMIGSEFADDPLTKGDVYTHAEAYARCPETRLVAVCDLDPERLTRCGERWGVERRYNKIEELIEAEQPDIVSVCTPDATHFEVTRAVLTSAHPVKAILCEKPLAMVPEQAEELIRLAEERSVVLAVEYTRRYAANMRALKSFIAAGELGRVQAISGWYTKGTLHNGTHWFDLVRFLVDEVTWVAALNAMGEADPDPTLDVTLGLKNGVMATLRTCDERSFTLFEMDIVGTLGRVQLLDGGCNIVLSRVAPSPRYSGYFELQAVRSDFGERRDLLLHAVEDLVGAIRNSHAPSCTGRDGLIALQIGCAAHKSALTGERVYLTQ